MAGIRRRLLLLTALVPSAAAACGRADPVTTQWQGPEQQPSPPPVTLPAVTPYVVPAYEPAPEVKRAAVRFIEALTNYGEGGGARDVVASRLAAIGAAPTLAEQAGPLVTADGLGAGEVVYPQLGGLTDNAASVMAVVRVHVRRRETLRSTVQTVDLRLTRVDTNWIVSAIAYHGGDPAPVGSPGTAGGSPPASMPAVATDVLASPQIELSDTTRSDVRSGRTDPRILQLLLQMSTGRRISVTVLSSGHPYEVFGTTRVSNHSRGRAVDIWAVDGRPVAEQRGEATSPARDITIQALTAGASEVGAPWVLSAGGRSSFTNTVHQDHIHIGLDR